MISFLRGTVTALGASHVVLDVNGVGMRVEATSSAVSGCRLGEHVQISTQLVVREDSLTLFGFQDDIELELFNLLTSVSGVGPRLALTTLSTLPASTIVAAITAQDDKTFTAVPGIGPKTGKLIVVSLHGKLSAVNVASAEAGPRADLNSAVLTITEALIGLGWSESASSDAVGIALRELGEATDQELLRSALAVLQNGSARRPA